MTDLSPRRVTLAGWPVSAILAGFIILALSCWTIWATRTIIAVRDRRVVSVRLTSLMQDFISGEARAARDPQAASVRTQHYIAALDHAVSSLARDGTIVLVSEATLGRSVEDVTGEVRVRVERSMGTRDDRR